VDLARAVEFPHPVKPAAPQCASCHAEPVERYAEGVHARALRADPDAPAATCAGCHGDHDILPARDPRSRTYHLTLPRTCGRCHGDEEMIRAAGIAAGNVPAAFEDSIHGQALSRRGLVVAPNCSSCHRAHDIHPAEDTRSPVFHANVPATCGRCHEGIRTEYDTSVHAKALAAGRSAAVCSDCHSAHGIAATGLPAWRLSVVEECGTCHEESIRTYRDGFHGQASALGFVRVATCADCHGAHGIAATADGRSRVHASNLVSTCGRCHPGANANFVQYDPHADAGRKERSRPVYYTALFMNVLLAGVFTFFAVHTALWFPRSLRERWRQSRSDGRAGR
jgi:nitrate/TMAO reductase-like tetraheme cytochrome c subunit